MRNRIAASTLLLGKYPSLRDPAANDRDCCHFSPWIAGRRAPALRSRCVPIKAERWQSGRLRSPRKRVSLYGLREFESPPLRQNAYQQCPGRFNHEPVHSLPAEAIVCWAPVGTSRGRRLKSFFSPNNANSEDSNNFAEFERRYLLPLPNESVAIPGANAIFLQRLTFQAHLD